METVTGPGSASWPRRYGLRRGAFASTEEIARAAGVAVGAVFRHSPTKPVLLGAVLSERMGRLALRATGMSENTDPGRAFLGFCDHLADLSRMKYTAADALAEFDSDLADVVQAHQQVLALVFGVARIADRTVSEQERGNVLGVVYVGLRPHATAR